MNRAFVITVVLMLSPFPAFSQTAPGGEGHDSSYSRKDRELEDILREQVLLALPMQRVCSETCKGFCPVCGKNRNETACDCKTEGTDDRWGALRNLEI